MLTKLFCLPGRFGKAIACDMPFRSSCLRLSRPTEVEHGQSEQTGGKATIKTDSASAEFALSSLC
jgi:hypothetical protein